MDAEFEQLKQKIEAQSGLMEPESEPELIGDICKRIFEDIESHYNENETMIKQRCKAKNISVVHKSRVISVLEDFYKNNHRHKPNRPNRIRRDLKQRRLY